MTDKVWVMVETVSQFRMRYMVQTPVDHPEYALDTVACAEAKEFSQDWVGETIMSHRILTEQEALEQCNKDNDYCKSWSDDQKINAFFTREGEKRYE